MSGQNKTAFLPSAGSSLSVQSTAIPTPGATEIVIANHAVSVQPIDAVQQKTGMYLRNFPHVLGHDVAGTVHAVGEFVTRFKVGDRVLAHVWGMATGVPEEGAFQAYSRVKAANAAKLPESLSFVEASVLPVALDTAVHGLYADGGLDFPWPGQADGSLKGKTLVIYGGSSSVGLSVLQLAKLSGVKVVAIAGKANHELVKKVGASEVFDYKSATLVEDVAKAVGSSDDFLGIYDAITNDATETHVNDIFAKLGNKGKLMVVHPAPESVPKSIPTKMMFAIGEFSAPFWENSLEKLLADGKIKPLPEPLVVGKGVESFDSALQRYNQGVSAQKLVVEL